jgi:iron complex transport system substrate-binding protein
MNHGHHLLVFAAALTMIFIQGFNSHRNRLTTQDRAHPARCRHVRHALGEACVPNQPQRVITLSVPSLANALALGITPIASVVYFDEPPPYLAEHLGQIEIIGKHDQPSLERILALDPDLIIGLRYGTEPTYNQLRRVAPTVADNWEGYPSWREHFEFVARVLGREELAQQAWDRYYARVQSLQAMLEEEQDPPEVSFIHTCCGTIDLDAANSFNGSILDDVGLRRPPTQAVPVHGGIIRLSQERLMDIDGDVLFVAAEGAEATQAITRLTQEPIWQKLRAVQAGRVHAVDYPTWRGGNLLAADEVIDDLVTYLVEESSQP